MSSSPYSDSPIYCELFSSGPRHETVPSKVSSRPPPDIGIDDATRALAKACTRYLLRTLRLPGRSISERHEPCLFAEDFHSLEIFIAWVVRHTEAARPVVIAALVYIRRLNQNSALRRLRDVRKIFMAALILALKFFRDISIPNISWVWITSAMYRPEVINRLEKTFCRDLKWTFNVSPKQLLRFDLEIDSLHDFPAFYRHRPEAYARSGDDDEHVTPLPTPGITPSGVYMGEGPSFHPGVTCTELYVDDSSLSAALLPVRHPPVSPSLGWWEDQVE